MVASGSMVPVLNINDLIIVWGKDNNTNFNSAKVNDIIVFRAIDPTEDNKTIVHRVVKIFQPGERLAGNKHLTICVSGFRYLSLKSTAK